MKICFQRSLASDEVGEGPRSSLDHEEGGGDPVISAPFGSFTEPVAVSVDDDTHEEQDQVQRPDVRRREPRCPPLVGAERRNRADFQEPP